MQPSRTVRAPGYDCRMTIQVRRSAPNRLVIGLAMASLLVLAACSTSASSTAPSPTTSAADPKAPAASTAPSGSAAASAGSTGGQTDTDWGRIWDTLPAGFPTIAGSTLSEEASAGPASAIFVVDDNAAKAIATSLQTQLQAAGYTTVALGGPLEDGTYTLDMTGPPTGCMIQVGATPTGSLTTVTILYGASCPHG
jgi:hypothetical protein